LTGWGSSHGATDSLRPASGLPILYGLAALTSLIVAVSIWRGLRGWPYRLAAGAVLLAALLNPSLQNEDREPLSDIVLVVTDASASQDLSDRPGQTESPLAELEAEIAGSAWKCGWPRSATPPTMPGRS
jgi:hypothetical protein